MVSLQQYSKEQIKEMSFLELAHLILADQREPITFKEMLSKIQKHLGVSDAEVRSRTVQFYTDLNVDGSFLSLGENRWGLRAWYPVEKLEEETTNAPAKTRKKKAKKAVIEDFEEELIEDDEIEDFDDEDFDEVDEDEDIDVEEDIDIDEEDLDEDIEEDDEEDILIEVDPDIEDDEFEEEEGAEDEYNLDDK
ncbi:DNA-directed RNA polymerase subunit delta [Domibacillus aminovorans]|uniref:Probable DNA-directed RNA polymerase subunit delta n=1 Tax=Domibacillus aminovorans TaxID=29332 RepID=A0A177KPC2_9BACI|nr:DNA-directed RNA polymerase subunit delta [Domibacillus aminovorans]OAH54411.1 DNA-directed RNA polymerase subunit delta [Domibacillus aminovorans]